MRRPILAVAFVVAIAGFVVVPEHRSLPSRGNWWDASYVPGTTGWSHTAYDAARIGTWTLLMAGALLLALGLISYARRPAR